MSISAPLLPRVSGTLLTVWTYVATTAQWAHGREAIGYRGAVSDTESR